MFEQVRLNRGDLISFQYGFSFRFFFFFFFLSFFSFWRGSQRKMLFSVFFVKHKELASWRLQRWVCNFNCS